VIFMSKKIVVLDGYTLNPGDLSWKELEKLGELTVYDRTDKSDVVKRIGNAEVIFTNKTVISKKVLDECANLKYIGVLATGYNVVDVEAAKAKGVSVTNIPTYGTTAVAQFAIALLLEICHNVGLHSVSVQNGDWSKCDDFCFWKKPLIELYGKTLGIIGMGKIGAATAKIASALGMNIICYDSYVNESLVEAGYKYVSINELLKMSDVISLHCPLFKETQGIINKDNISKMKDGVIIINTSRGPLIVEEDLVEALKSGKIYAAGLDVVSAEPINEDNALLGIDNCIITPHIAWAPMESRKRLMDIAVNNLTLFINGEPTNIVNK